ncbi:MAG: ATP synthase F1 subunit epsilon [Anaerolineae bacterium]|nr:ATP synthase F1 subunit epsilon [Anaerolineae bacterium]
MPIHVEVVTQERLILDEPEADMIVLPGSEGVLGVLPRHTPLLTTLAIGELRIKKGTQETVLAVYGGIVEVRPDKVVVLADMAESADEIDLESAEAARRRAEEMMRKGPPPDELAIISQELRRAELAVRVRRKTQSRAGSVRIRSGNGEEKP